MPGRKTSLIGGIVLLLALAVSPVLAQGGAIAYGDNAIGSLTPSAPLAFFTFSGTAGDLVTVQALEVTPGLAPTISLLGPAQQVLATSLGDPFGLGEGEARLSFRLMDSGVHSLLVSSTSGAAGDFLLRLRGAGPAASAGVGADAPAVADVLPGGGPQMFSVAANPADVLPVSVSTTTPGFAFAVQVRDPLGQLVSVLAGSESAPAVFLLPPGQGVYDLAVVAQAPGVPGSVMVAVGAPLPAEAVVPVSQPTGPITAVTATPVPAEGGGNGVGPVCRIRSGTNINMRLTPSLTAPVVGVLVPNAEQPVAGVSEDGVWLALEFNGQAVWVAADAVLTNGPCNQLPVIQPGQPLPSATPTVTATTVPGMTATSTLTATATATTQGVVQVTATRTPTFTATATQPQQQVQPSPTFTPSYTPTSVPPTATYTPSYTPTTVPPTFTYTPSYTPTTVPPTATFTPSFTPTSPVPVAPPDANFNSPLNIPLDSTASTTDFVSYPGGDTQDRVRWDITGMNPNAALSGGRARLIIAVSCFGTGTNQIQFFTGGQTYTCGQTIVDREVTYDSRTGQVTITAVGGTNTYVQWVLTGTASRVN